MMSKEIGKFEFSIAPEALEQVISDGRLLEFASTVANHAAAQISAQLVDEVAKAAVSRGGLGATSVGAVFLFEGGDYATVPPRPPWGVGPIPRVDNPLQRFAAQGEVS